jgi:protein SCO1/2
MMGRLRYYFISLVWLLGSLSLSASAVQAQEPLPQDLIRQVGFDQNLEQQLPLDLAFTDSLGQPVRLGDYFGQKPVILLLGYYECPMLCSLVRNGLFESLQKLDFSVGEEFELVVVSIDPRETPEIAEMKRQVSIVEYNRISSEDGWHFLVGQQEAISRLASAIGFRYTYDPKLDQYVHPSGIVLLTPQGKIARYFYGIDFLAQDLRLGLVEAADNKIGSPIDQLWLLCYHYDPVSGKYTPVIMNVIRIAGFVTVTVIGGVLYIFLRNDRKKTTSSRPA